MQATIKKRIWLSPPHMGGMEQEFIKEAFDTNWIAPLGANVNTFEEQLKQFTGTKSALALNSGTGALHLALRVLNIQPGDLVFCQSMTFAASAFPILYEGAVPVFIDSEPDTWNMDPELLAQALEANTKKGKKVAAIIVVDLYGMPAKLYEIEKLAQQYNVPLIEDAAEALGSVYKTRSCGSFGTMGVLSFNGNKIITTSGGGALIGNETHLIEEARFLSTQAKEPFPHYEHNRIGFNYRMSNIVAGIGRGQMMVLTNRVEKRRANYEFYKEQLQQLPGISFLNEPDEMQSNRWLTTILIDPASSGGITNDLIRNMLDEQNIESRPLWKPMHTQPVFKDAPAFVNGISEQLFSKGLCLPSGSSLTTEELTMICTLIKNCWNER